MSDDKDTKAEAEGKEKKEGEEKGEGEGEGGEGDDDSLFTKKTGIMKRRRKKKDAKEAAFEQGGDKGGAFLRVQRDINELEVPENVKIDYATKGDLMNFSLTIKPNMGYWNGGLYEFKFQIPAKYPFEGPRVTCGDKIYHPNIDLEGKVCVNVLRPWKSTYTIQIILFALLFLFSNPNPNDPLNNEAAADMRADKKRFATNVTQSMKGYSVSGVTFPRNRGTGF